MRGLEVLIFFSSAIAIDCASNPPITIGNFSGNTDQKKESKFEEHMPEIYLVKSQKLIVYDNFNQSIQTIFQSVFRKK